MSVVEMKPVRQRILDAAMQAYYRDGIRSVSADRLIAEAQVSKVTFYRHFPTKDDLVAEYLRIQAENERALVVAQRAEHADDPAAVLRWYAASVGELSCQPGFRGCAFINAAAELTQPEHAGRIIIADHRAWLIGQATELLTQLGVESPGRKAEQLLMLRDGAMVAGQLGRTPDQAAATLLSAGCAVIKS